MSAVLLKPNVANILLFNFCEQKFVQHGPITIAIVCYGLCLLIFEEEWPNYASEPKSAANSDSFCVRRLYNVCVRGFCAPNATILLVYIPANIKMSLIWKDDFFLPKSPFLQVDRRSTFQHYSSVCTTIFVRRKDKTNYMSSQAWAKCYHSQNKH